MLFNQADNVSIPDKQSTMQGDTATPSSPSSMQEIQEQQRQEQQWKDVHFNVLQWASTGVMRVLYRNWTRIAAHVFPEESLAQRLALKLRIPLPDQLNLSWITKHLAVGGRIRLGDIVPLGRLGVTHVIDTRSEYVDDREALAQERIELLHLPTPDTCPLSVEHLMKGSTWANEKMRQGGCVLIHCEHGVGRSVLLTCAVLVGTGMGASDALELVKSKRWQAAPNHRQIERLREFEAFSTRKRMLTSERQVEMQ